MAYLHARWIHCELHPLKSVYGLPQTSITTAKKKGDIKSAPRSIYASTMKSGGFGMNNFTLSQTKSTKGVVRLPHMPHPKFVVRDGLLSSHIWHVGLPQAQVQVRDGTKSYMQSGTWLRLLCM